jgi:hypothetical protein
MKKKKISAAIIAATICFIHKMKPFIYHTVVYTLLFVLLQSCENRNEKAVHLGGKKTVFNIEVDSIVIDASYSSGRGNFYMEDSVITFADSYYSTFFHYDMNTEEYSSRHFGRGNGPDELNGFLWAYPAGNKKRTFIIDNSNFLTSFDDRFDLTKHGMIDFGWKNVQSSSEFDSPANYNVMEMADFGINLSYPNDSTLLIPVNIIKRYTSEDGMINRKHYTDGCIFGELNMKTMKIEKVFGQFPEIYNTLPVPHLEFFQYAIKEDTIYVNHAIDSLIYVYKYPDRLLHTTGYECDHISRGYTKTRVVDEGESFMHDMQETGINTGLKYIPQTDCLIRTYMKKLTTGESGIQIYQNNDLIGDFAMPPYFIFLGYYKGIYYGTKIKPIETEDETMFVFYKFRLSEIE